MESSKKPPENTDAAKNVAAIDVGANALRMAIAEVLPDGRINTFERLQRAVRLGQDTFRRGRIGGESMRAAITVLRDYRQVLDLYNVEQVRSVATTAVREASNADIFIDRVFMATGLQVDVIDPAEESRLTVSAVRRAVGGAMGINRDETLIVDVGGGSTLLTVLQDGEIAASQSLRLGSIRLQEILSTSEELPERSAELFRHHIVNSLSTFQGSMPLESVRSFVAVGGDARFAACRIGKPTESPDLVKVDRRQFDRLVDRCGRHTAEELSKQYGLPFAEAETLNPALLIYQILLHKCRTDSMIVSHVSMRDGLLMELACAVTGKEDESLLAGVIRSAMTIAEKYRIDMKHARDVAELSVRLFDQLKSDHGLSSRHRLLLRVAGLLHEIGEFVSSRSHHKHSYYLIGNSEIFGLNSRETEIVAQVARYHRHAAPRPSHLQYTYLPRETRLVVIKLAALLRVADALVRGQLRESSDFQFDRQGDELLIYVPGGADMLLVQRAIAARGELFEDVYGMKIRLEEA